MFINEALVNPCLLNSEIILMYFASNDTIIMDSHILNNVISKMEKTLTYLLCF